MKSIRTHTHTWTRRTVYKYFTTRKLSSHHLHWCIEMVVGLRYTRTIRCIFRRKTFISDQPMLMTTLNKTFFQRMLGIQLISLRSAMLHPSAIDWSLWCMHVLHIHIRCMHILSFFHQWMKEENRFPKWNVLLNIIVGVCEIVRMVFEGPANEMACIVLGRLKISLTLLFKYYFFFSSISYVQHSY